MASPIGRLLGELPRLDFAHFVAKGELADALEAGDLGPWAQRFVAIEPVLKTGSGPSVERLRASKREHPSQGGGSSSGLPTQGDHQPRAKKRPTARSRQQRLSAQEDQPDASSRLRASNREDGAVEREDDIILCPRAPRPRGSIAAEELPMGRNIVSGYGHHGNEIIDVSM